MDKQRVHTNPRHYSWLTEQLSPPSPLGAGLGRAFWVGGLICVLGQYILNTAEAMGLGQEEAGSWCSLILIFLSVLLTGLNVYPKLAKFAGAGTLVPITGFANSVAAPAIEYQKEGQVFGIGCKIFTIAGPVILYGVLSSWILGVVYYVMQLWR